MKQTIPLPHRVVLCVKVTQSRLTLCNSMDYIVHEILQAGILEWVAFPFSRGSSQPRDGTQVSCTAGGHAVSPALILLVSQGQNITEPHQLKTLFTYLKKMSHFLFSLSSSLSLASLLTASSVVLSFGDGSSSTKAPTPSYSMVPTTCHMDPFGHSWLLPPQFHGVETSSSVQFSCSVMSDSATP